MANSEDALNFFYQYGSRIWERMRFARVRNQRVSETTVTENLIFDFWYQAKADRLPIEIYEAKAEQQNGNDLEVFIETKRLPADRIAGKDPQQKRKIPQYQPQS